MSVSPQNLRRRIVRNHLRRSGQSTLRRTLAGLLLDTEHYRTRRTDRVVLIDEDETRLTAWMHTYLQLSWCQHPTPDAVEAAVIAQWAPPLNVAHASGPARAAIEAARAAYSASTKPEDPSAHLGRLTWANDTSPCKTDAAEVLQTIFDEIEHPKVVPPAPDCKDRESEEIRSHSEVEFLAG